MEYGLQSKINKKILWGDLDSDFFFNDLKNYVERLEYHSATDKIEFNFQGINSIDYSFINEVFIKLSKDFGKNYILKFLFKNIENDSIIYYLDKSFNENDLTASIEINGKEFNIGKREYA